MSAPARPTLRPTLRPTIRPTIRDVATAAGVSIGTVSNVLTGARSVAASTRARVEAAITLLGYAPDPAGRVLNSRRRRGPQAPSVDLPRLTTLGYLCADLTARLTVLPGPDQRATAQVIEKRLGGAAANVAVVAAGLGGPFALWVELLTVLGTDPESDWAASLLADRGVALAEGARRSSAQLSRCIVLVDGQGNRTIVNEPLQVTKDSLVRWLERLPSGSNRHCLHIQGDQLTEVMDVLPQAHARGLLLACHAPGMPLALRSVQGLRLIAGLFDLVFLDRHSARAIAGTAGENMAGEELAGEEMAGLVATFGRLLDGPRRATLIVTLEAQGAALFEPGEPPRLVPARPVVPVDRTGAGDCFAGIYLAVWLAGRPALEACRAAVLAAGRSVLVPGAQEYRPSAAALADLADQEPI